MLPNLIHPINIQIAQLDRDSTLYDGNAREPIGNSQVESIITLPAQVKWNHEGKPAPQFSGIREQDKCYLLFRWKDLNVAGVTLKRGDRIKKIGHRTVNLFITHFEDVGHYPDQDGASLMQAWCADRNPSEKLGDL